MRTANICLFLLMLAISFLSTISLGNDIDEWVTIDSLYSQKSISPGTFRSFRLDMDSLSITALNPNSNLDSLSLAALERAPAWMRLPLSEKFELMSDFPEIRNQYAILILETEDPYIDEICFSLAHLSPSVLLSDQFTISPELLLENVIGIYEADVFLDYVQINDYGTSQDENFWSTVEYTTVNGEDTLVYEVEREIYYWFVMFPRISYYEIPSYINPLNNSFAWPETGKFWRNYFLYEPDEGYNSLSELLSGCEIMYGNLWNDTSANNGAIGLISSWIQDILTYDAGNTYQPVGIYHNHHTQCWGFMEATTAAARAALIPATGTCSKSHSHFWNEFWDGNRWVSWEPLIANIGDSLNYLELNENFGIIYNFIGDGNIWNVSQRYHTETTSLTISIFDHDGNPVNGARVQILTSEGHPLPYFCGAGFTNSEGEIDFIIGPGTDIQVQISSGLGHVPVDPEEQPFTSILIIDNTDPMQEYNWEYYYANSLSETQVELTDPPFIPSEAGYNLSIDYEILEQAVYGKVFNPFATDEAEFIAENGDGILDFYVCDEENYQLFNSGQAFDAFYISQLLTGDDPENIPINISLTDSGQFYAIFSNMNSFNVYQRFNTAITLGRNESGFGDFKQNTLPADYGLQSIYPNPFNSCTEISFVLPRGENIRLAVYDILGRQVQDLAKGFFNAGLNTVIYNSTNQSSGIYFVALYTIERTYTEKMIIMK